MTDETQQASAERASQTADKGGQAELPVAAVTRSHTGIEEIARDVRALGRRDDEERW